jgi:hypothetical protein
VKQLRVSGKSEGFVEESIFWSSAYVLAVEVGETGVYILFFFF